MRIETDMDVLLYTSRRGTAITVKPNGTNGICCNVSHGRHPCSMIVGFVELIADRTAEVVIFRSNPETDQLLTSIILKN